jgi:hypothetical protein
MSFFVVIARDGEWLKNMLVVPLPAKLPPLFFDLEKDPGEFVNRVNDPAYLPLVLEYAQKLLSWRMNHDEQTLTHIALTPEGPVERRARLYRISVRKDRRHAPAFAPANAGRPSDANTTKSDRTSGLH